MEREREYTIGIDCGSTLCKGVLLGHEGIAASCVLPTGWNLRETASRVAAELKKTQAGSKLPIIATGYGREQVAERTRAVTEISAHARGAAYLLPEVRTVIDIGGQDCKVIAVEDGRVRSFQMNDKCAAGTGRFVQMVLERFGSGLVLLDEMLSKGKAIQLNSTCAVFAESEIIGLLAQGHTREEIVGGVALSLAVKISSLAARCGVRSPVVLSGGLSESSGIRAALSRALNVDVQHAAQGLYAGAIGAACMGLSDASPLCT
ncbi:acyl-CoA dehydratase activase [Breznakiellaceae bacterium SP9]